MEDQAQGLREFVKTLPADHFGPSFPGHLTMEPTRRESFEDYQTKLAFHRVRDELKTGGV